MAQRKKQTKKPMGRPRTEMTPENIEAILRSIRLGLHPERAAQAAGVSLGAFRMHKKRHPDFVRTIKEAETIAEQGFLGRILRHTEKQWTAAAWVLERRWPEQWRKRDGEELKAKVSDKQVTGQASMHEALVDMINAAIAGKVTFKQLKDMAQSLGIASDISERADLEERIKKLEGDG